MGFCNCSMFCCALLYVQFSFAIILMGKRDLDVLPSLSFWCLVVVVWLFLVVSWVCLQFVIVVFSDHTNLLFVIVVFFLFFFADIMLCALSSLLRKGLCWLLSLS